MHKLIIAHLFSLLLSSTLCNANQQTHLLRSTRPHSFSVSDSWLQRERDASVAPQDGLMQEDKITQLPGQPHRVGFDHYAGYVTVEPQAGRALFYYFAESPTNSSTKPLVLWLNGGPGCSSFGYGAMEELGPFRVNSDGTTLYRNNYAWNNVANVIFLDSPAGVGFSYSNTTADYNNTGDTSTATDAYTFIVIWLERFPQYKTRDFYITGESYAGHYVPQLANTILLINNNSNSPTVINLNGVAIGNALIDDASLSAGFYDHVWTHALISDEIHTKIFNSCDFANNLASDRCYDYVEKSFKELGNIDINNNYAPICLQHVLKKGSSDSSGEQVNYFDPCSDVYVKYYLNMPQVQAALHVKPTAWDFCRTFDNWTDWESSVLPTIENLMASGLRVWLYSGDIDTNVPVTTTRYAINRLKLPVETAWRPWYFENEVGGYVVGYKGLTLATVRGAGHEVPSYQPQRALLMFTSFLQGILPPSSS